MYKNLKSWFWGALITEKIAATFVARHTSLQEVEINQNIKQTYDLQNSSFSICLCLDKILNIQRAKWDIEYKFYTDIYSNTFW